MMKNCNHPFICGMVFYALFVILLFSGCEDPGNVGSSFTDTNTSIVVDTFSVTGLETDQTLAFSGELDFFSIGQFNDPLFGDITLIGMLRPALSGTGGNNFIDTDSEVKLELNFNREFVYGDTSSTAEFDLIEMKQIWRAGAWRLNNQIELAATTLNSFSTKSDSIIQVSLPSEWVLDFREFFNSTSASQDSLYEIEFPGIAIVPKNSAQIIPVNPDDTNFIITNPDDSDDTLRVGLFDWAHKLDRANVQAPPAGNKIIHSTLESLISFNTDLSRERLGTVNITRAELVLYQNNQLTEQTLDQVSPNAVRTVLENGLMYFIESENLPFAIDQGVPVGRGEFNDSNNSLNFEITSFVNGAVTGGLPVEERFYITISNRNNVTSDGILRSGIFYDSNGPPGRRPVLIITSIQSESAN